MLIPEAEAERIRNDERIQIYTPILTILGSCLKATSSHLLGSRLTVKRKDRTFLIIVFLLPSVFILSLLYTPYIKAFYISLFNWSGLSLYKDFVGLENFSAFLEIRFSDCFKNNLFI